MPVLAELFMLLACQESWITTPPGITTPGCQGAGCQRCSMLRCVALAEGDLRYYCTLLAIWQYGMMGGSVPEAATDK